MQVQARGKINWTLNVTGVRPDGYHLLDMLMKPIALCDTLILEDADDISLCIDGAEGLSPGEDNLVLRAAFALREKYHVSRGAGIRLIKRIPMGAGLGGGSADAAAALKGLCALWGLDADMDALCRLGLRLGADVPFCLHDAPRRAQGIGEILTPFESRVYPLILLQPCRALSTREVFAAYHRGDFRRADNERSMEALGAGNLFALRETAANALESASIPMRPEIAEAKEALYETGAALAQMTGSGSVVFGAYETNEAADKAFLQLRNLYPVCIRTQTAI